MRHLTIFELHNRMVSQKDEHNLVREDKEYVVTLYFEQTLLRWGCEHNVFSSESFATYNHRTQDSGWGMVWKVGGLLNVECLWMTFLLYNIVDGKLEPKFRKGVIVSYGVGMKGFRA